MVVWQEFGCLLLGGNEKNLPIHTMCQGVVKLPWCVWWTVCTMSSEGGRKALITERLFLLSSLKKEHFSRNLFLIQPLLFKLVRKSGSRISSTQLKIRCMRSFSPAHFSVNCCSHNTFGRHCPSVWLLNLPKIFHLLSIGYQGERNKGSLPCWCTCFHIT